MPISSPPTLGLRERKRNACAAQIHQAAVRLVAEQGYEAVTVAQIAQAAEVSPKTVFNYWGTKDGAILGIVEEGVGPFWANSYLDPGNPDPYVPLIEFFAARTVDQTQEHAQRMTQVFREQPRLGGLRHSFMQGLAEELAELCARKLQQLRPDQPEDDQLPEARLLVGTALAVARHAWQEWARARARTRFEDHLATSLALQKKLCADFAAQAGPPTPSRGKQ